MEKFRITLNGVTHEVEVEKVGSASGAAAPVAKKENHPAPAPAAAPAAPKAAAQPKANVPAGATTINAPMPGKILSVNTTVGQAVKRGEVLLILEAMKMANEIMAPADGKIGDILVTAGQTVSTGEALIVLN
jgi:glutaconyl-CoA/methylmalonyl-CoA decarboxylase subunit gamma